MSVLRAVLVCAIVAAPAIVLAGDGNTLLIRVERQSPTDLVPLLDGGFPVVMELDTCLLVRGSASDLARLAEAGRTATVLDDRADTADYLVAGLRPDSDLGALRGAGPEIHRESNWVIVRTPRDATIESLADARVFATRVGREPVERPRAMSVAAETESKSATLAPADPIVQKIVSTVLPADIDAIWTDITQNPPTGTRYTTSQGCRDASTYCYNKYTSYGIPAQYQTWNAGNAPNVVGTQEGATDPSIVYIVEGHLDDLPSSGSAPGADDNASGSVTVVEAAKVMSCWAYRNTVKYLVVTGEESGLNGSEYYANDAHSRNEDIRGVVNLDMPGWEGDGSPNPENLDVDYNAASQWLGELYAECASKYGTGLAVDAFLCPSLSASDHYPFWTNGYPAICGITDNEDYCGHGGNYPYYHQSTDTIANCGNKTFFYGAVKTSVATVAEMAKPFKVTPRKSAYGCGSALDLVLGDRDLNTSASSAQTVGVEVWSGTEPTPETVVLTERGVNSMLFDGTIATTSGAAVHGDGLLSVAPGDTVTVRYVDGHDCDGASNVTYTSTATIDCARPIISGVGSTNVTDTSATIAWTTNEAASSVVHWGGTKPPSQTTTGTGPVTAHSVNLTGLQACTVYNFSVESGDVAGNVATDDSGGQYYHFETYGNFGSGLQPCHAGRVVLGADAFACGAAAAFQVVDMDLNANPYAAETTVLRVTSTSETVPEIVVATETGPNTSTFSASIALTQGAAAPDGLLTIHDGDVITVTYLDANDGTGASAVSFDTATVDCAGPGIRNLRITDVTDQRFTVRYDTDTPGTTKIEYGTTAGLGQTYESAALATSHTVLLNRFDLCTPEYLRVSSSDAVGNVSVSDQGGTPYRVHTWGIPGLYWRETFESGGAGWTLQGEWQVGAPQGRGGSSGSPDPAAAYNNVNAMGNDLTGLGAHSGDYEYSITENATGPAQNGSAWTNAKLLVYRQLNVRKDDVATISIMKGNRETPVYASTGQTITQSGWAAVSYDVSGIADGQRSVAVRFGIVSDAFQQFNDDGVASGWNVDDVILKDGTLPDYGPCGGCTTAPSFAGARSASDDDACGATGVTVSWDPVVSWGTGGAGTYAVYRGATPDFVPGPSNLVTSGVATLTYHDAAAPTNASLWYVVRAENDETCGSGPHNSGLTDGNTSRAAVSETTTRPMPQPVGTLRADMINEAHVRLAWDATSGASTYRIYRSASAAPGGFVLLAETANLFWDDLGQGGNGNTWYYQVRGVNACGQE